MDQEKNSNKTGAMLFRIIYNNRAHFPEQNDVWHVYKTQQIQIAMDCKPYLNRPSFLSMHPPPPPTESIS